jgi:hypothetical protein
MLSPGIEWNDGGGGGGGGLISFVKNLTMKTEK